MTCTHVSGDVASGHGAAIGLVRADGFDAEMRGKPCLARNEAKFGNEREHQTKTKKINELTRDLLVTQGCSVCRVCLVSTNCGEAGTAWLVSG